MSTAGIEGRAHGRALFISAFAGCLLFLATGAWASAVDCGSGRIDAYAQVRRVHDGDTVELADGRRVRLIGLNTPELGRDGKAPEPLAVAARDALRRLLADQRRVALRYGRDRRDRYGRTLAHLFLDDRRNINAWLIRRGYAAVVAVPPNLWGQSCYQRSEVEARRRGLGIWGLDYYRPLPAAALRGITGFRLIEGRVSRVARSRRSIWLNLEGGAALRIARKDLRYFPADFHPRSYEGRRIEARGWIHPYRGRPTLQVRHPYALRLLP